MSVSKTHLDSQIIRRSVVLFCLISLVHWATNIFTEAAHTAQSNFLLDIPVERAVDYRINGLVEKCTKHCNFTQNMSAVNAVGARHSPNETHGERRKPAHSKSYCNQASGSCHSSSVFENDRKTSDITSVRDRAISLPRYASYMKITPTQDRKRHQQDNGKLDSFVEFIQPLNLNRIRCAVVIIDKREKRWQKVSLFQFPKMGEWGQRKMRRLNNIKILQVKLEKCVLEKQGR